MYKCNPIYLSHQSTVRMFNCLKIFNITLLISNIWILLFYDLHKMSYVASKSVFTIG